MAENHTLRIILPGDWHEVPGQSPREFRSNHEGGGVLQIETQPAQPQLQENPSQLLPWVVDFARKKLPEIESAIFEEPLECVAGPGVFSLRRSRKYDTIGLWAIASRQMIVAIYKIGEPDVAQVEIEDAMTIITSVYFEDEEENQQS